MNLPAAPHRGPKVGDTIHLHHEESGSVLVGTVRLSRGLGLHLDVDGHPYDLDRAGWHIEYADVEPPLGSVVIDADGDAWQRRADDDWSCSFHGLMRGQYDGQTWAALIAQHGPVVIVHEATP